MTVTKTTYAIQTQMGTTLADNFDSLAAALREMPEYEKAFQIAKVTERVIYAANGNGVLEPVPAFANDPRPIGGSND